MVNMIVLLSCFLHSLIVSKPATINIVPNNRFVNILFVFMKSISISAYSVTIDPNNSTLPPYNMHISVMTFFDKLARPIDNPIFTPYTNTDSIVISCKTT